MGVRESGGQTSKLGVGAAAAILVIGLGLILFQFIGKRQSAGYKMTQGFYTDDDGKTFFKDDLYKVIPFDRNGKKAYRADVYQCPDGKQFVAFMYRQTPMAQKAMQDFLAKGKSDAQGAFLGGLEIQGMEVKAPGAPESAWKPSFGTAQQTVNCPSGGVARPVAP